MLTTRLSLSTTKPSNLNDLIQNFYTLVENLKSTHHNELRHLTRQIEELQLENEQLRNRAHQQSHSIFNIDYIPEQSLTIEQLRNELQRSRLQIDALQKTLDEKYLEYEDMKSKYNLQRIMNEHSSTQPTTNPNRVQELERKIQQMKEQLQQFDQCHYESEEQIRLLNEILTRHDLEPLKSVNQSLTVKQADLIQQTDIIENILQKQEEKILDKLLQYFDRSSSPNIRKPTKRKRL